MAEVVMTRHQTILLMKGANQHQAVFSREPDEPGDIPDFIRISKQDWNDMGRPRTITVEVRPGSDIRD